jgi:hypothetical protein
MNQKYYVQGGEGHEASMPDDVPKQEPPGKYYILIRYSGIV